jgi:hemolysin activation/secretion protein
VSKETDFSIAHLVDEGNLFAPNRRAERADEAGGALTLRLAAGQNPAKVRGGVQLHADASFGTFDFTRESATVYLGAPLPFRLSTAVELSAGTSTGTVPIQSLWYLGGVRSMRGYTIDAQSGNAYWRARAEIGRGLPVFRLTGFTDFGWAGERTNVQSRASMLSVGAGASFLDGLIRIDLARSLRGQRDWRLHASVDGIL